MYLVCEKPPDWYKGNIIFYKEEDKKLPRNILYKIQASFEQAGDTVLQWQDDLYLTRPFHVEQIKYWYHGTLGKVMAKMHGAYKRMIENTAMKITDNALYYDIHVPIVYEKKHIDTLVNDYNWAANNYLVKSLYCHVARVWDNAEMENCKINDPVDDIAKVVGYSLFFSTGPQGICPAMEKYLESLYPEPSRFE